MSGHARNYLIATTVALLNFGGDVSTWMSSYNRYLYLWNHADGIIRITLIIALATLAFSIDLMLKHFRFERASRLYRYGLIIALAGGIFTCIPPEYFSYQRGVRRVAWLLVIGLAAYAYFFQRKAILQGAKNLCLILSPIVPLAFIQLIMWPSWYSEFDPLKYGEIASDAGPPIVFVVCDEWSYERTFQEHLDEQLPNLTDLRKTSVFFKEARSPSDMTTHSLPAILYQTDRVFLQKESFTGWEVDGQLVPSDQSPSIFDVAHQHGYSDALVGFYLPYRKILGPTLDCCRGYPHDPKGHGLLSRAAMVVAQTPLSYPFIGRFRLQLVRHIESEYWVELNDSIYDDILGLAEQAGNGTVLFAHWPLPHGPFVLSRTGEYLGPYKQYRMDGTQEQYEEHLMLLDRRMGEIFDTLRKRGVFDKSLIILTADHSWRRDPDQNVQQHEFWSRHVPLIVKLPGQTEPKVIERPFSLTELAPIIEATMKGAVPSFDTEVPSGRSIDMKVQEQES